MSRKPISQEIRSVKDYEDWTVGDELREYGEDQGIACIAVGSEVYDRPEDMDVVIADAIREHLGDVSEVWVHDEDGMRCLDRTDADSAP